MQSQQTEPTLDAYNFMVFVTMAFDYLYDDGSVLVVLSINTTHEHSNSTIERIIVVETSRLVYDYVASIYVEPVGTINLAVYDLVVIGFLGYGQFDDLGNGVEAYASSLIRFQTGWP